MYRTIELSLLAVCFYILPAYGNKRSITPDSLNLFVTQAKQLLPGQLDEAEELATIVLHESTALSNDSLHSKANYILGLIHYFRGQYLISSQYYQNGLESDYAHGNDLFAAALWNNLGINREHELEYENALDAYLKSLNFAEMHGDSLSIYQSYINTGLIYIWLKDYSAAERFLQQALNYFTRKRDDNHLGLCYHNLGVLYENTNKNDKVADKFDLAISHYQAAGNQHQLSTGYFDKINFLLNQQKYKEAKTTIDEAKALASYPNPHKEGNMLLAQGRYYLEGEYEPHRSETCFLKAIEKYKECNVQKQIIHAWLNLSLLYAKNGDIDKHKEAILKYDSLFHQHYSEASGSKIAQMRTLYEVQKKEQQIIELTSQKRRRALWLAYIVIVSFLIIITILIILYVNRKRSFKALQKTLMLENEHMLKVKQLEQMELKHQLNKKESANYKLNLELKEQELIYQTLKNAGIEKLNQSVNEKLKPFAHRMQRKKDQEKFQSTLQEISRDISRDPLADFENMFMQMHGGFYEKLLEICPVLSKSELQTCALLRMNLPSKEIASILNLSLSTIDQRRHSIRKKMRLKSNENLVSYLICIGKEIKDEKKDGN